MLPSHLALYHIRSSNSRPSEASATTLAVRDLLFTTEFYVTLFGHSYRGWLDGVQRLPLIRTTVTHAALGQIDDKLQSLRENEEFKQARVAYALGRPITSLTATAEEHLIIARQLALYLVRECAPPARVLALL